ncbi:MAG: hypothetical protein ACREER_08685, partial [Alphaproteobacteria bacterium]
MTYLMLGLGILILGLALAWEFQRASPSALARWIRGIAAFAALAIGGYLIFTGRFAHAVAALVGAAVLFTRLRRSGLS